MHHIPGPAELARDSIKAANDARGRPAILAVKDLMPCNNDTPDNGRWRVDRHIARRHLAHANRGIDLPICSEVLTGTSRSRIQCEYPRVKCADDDPPFAAPGGSSPGPGITSYRAAESGRGAGGERGG